MAGHVSDSNGAGKASKSPVILLALLAASLSLNVYLGLKVQGTSPSGSPRAESKLSAGANVPPVEASDLQGQKATITYADKGKPTVLYVFSPKCGWCSNNMENIRTLSDARKDSFSFVGLSLAGDKLEGYVNAHRLDMPVYQSPSSDALNTLGLGSTPQTIVISAEGKVIKNWIGAYTGEVQADVEKYFGLELPGVADAQASGAPSRCVTCLQDGREYSVGSKVKLGDAEVRCQENGQWAKL